MTTWTGLGTEVLVEVVIRGLDHPLLAEELTIWSILSKAIVTTINATVKPIATVSLKNLLQILQWGLLPSVAGPWLFPVELHGRVLSLTSGQ